MTSPTGPDRCDGVLPASASEAETARLPADPGEASADVKAPFPYFGGKSRVAAQVWARLGNPDTYVEPFGGSLAVLLARPASHEWWLRRETVGDFTGHVVNFFRAVRADAPAVGREAAWPITEADLTARHLWLVRYHDELAEKLAADPDFYDVRAAAWWVWGVSAWVGGEWCSGLGPWHPGDPAGPGVYRKMPMLSGNHGGKGVHRPVRSVPGRDETGFPMVAAMYEDALVQQFSRLANRLHRVRIACGDWSRLTKSAVTPSKGQKTGVFLDPPYDLALRRGDLYGPTDRDAGPTGAVGPVRGKRGKCSDGPVLQPHEAARDWALSIGDDPSLRIAYCGYSNPEEDALFAAQGWSPLRWTAAGGYGLQADNSARGNRHLEIVWFSPHCLTDDSDPAVTPREGELL